MRKLFLAFLVLVSMVLSACIGSDSNAAVTVNNGVVADADATPAELSMTDDADVSTSAADLCGFIDAAIEETVADQVTETGDEIDELLALLPDDLASSFSAAETSVNMNAFFDAVKDIDVHTTAECGYPFFQSVMHAGNVCTAPSGAASSAECIDPRAVNPADLPTIEESFEVIQANAELVFQDISNENPGDNAGNFEDVSDEMDPAVMCFETDDGDQPCWEDVGNQIEAICPPPTEGLSCDPLTGEITDEDASGSDGSGGGFKLAIDG